MGIKRLIADPFNKKKISHLNECQKQSLQVVLDRDRLIAILQKANDLLQAQLIAQEQHIDIQEKALKKKQFLLDIAEEKAQSAENMFKTHNTATRSNKGKVTDTDMIRECYRHFSGHKLTSFHKITPAEFSYQYSQLPTPLSPLI